VIVGWNQFDPALAADGRPALLTRMGGITAVTTGADGLTLIAGSGRVRQIGADGLVRTLISDQNMATQVRLAADRQGNIYYSVTLGIKKRTPAGSTVAVAGVGPGLPQEGAVAANTWVQVQGMALDPAGNLVFSEGQSRSVWRIDSGGTLRRVTGDGGPAASAQLEYPGDLAFDASGTLYIRDQARVLKIGADGNLVPLDSSAVPGYGGVLTADAGGRVFVTGSGGFQIFRLERNGSFSSFAGTGDDAFSNGCASAANPTVGDAKTARFGPITGMAVDPAGNLLVVDQSHYLLREVTPAGQVRTLAGAPPSFSGDGGPASAATLDAPQGIAFDAAGNMYIADTGNHRIRKVTTDGIIRSIAGQNGPTGDMTYECSGAGPEALRLPQAVAVATNGDVFIADTGNNRVMKLTADGTLTRFAGTGTWGFASSPLGTRADSVPLAQPRAVGVDRAGNVWIGDNATRTLKIAPDGTIADVLPRLRPRSFSADTQGNLYLTSGYVVYQVMDGDQLVQVAGTIRDSQIPPTGTPPVNELDTTLDISAGSGLTRDGLGTLYNIGQGGIDLISTGCHTEPGFLPAPRGAAHVAENPAGDVYAADAGSNVIWRLPHLTMQPGDLPTPLLSAGTSVQNAASMLVSSQDAIVPTGGFSSATIRYLVNPPIAPGEIVRINGQCLGPVEQVRASVDSDGRLPVSLAGVQITMAGLPVPLIAVQEGSIVAVTPFALPVNQNVAFVITVNGVEIKGTLQTMAFNPGLVRFLQPDGTAAAAAVNQDGTLNSQANPAPAGSMVAFYATGLGQTNPPGIDGQVVTDIGASYLADIQVTINGVPGKVQYAGPAPGFTGLSQINVLVPQTTTGPVKVLVANVPFQQIVQLWVR
jgi:uncharacterized protein (TIGR03437 family)